MSVTTIDTGRTVWGGSLHYVHVEQAHYEPTRHNDEGIPTGFEFVASMGRLPTGLQAAVDSMEPDNTRCDVCSALIGEYLREDPETTADVGAFAEFVVAQVGLGPVKRLCADCAEVVFALMPEPTR